MSSEIKWKQPYPRTAVQMLVVDNNSKLLIMHRSNNVRSARNVWSFPSGLHDIGESLFETGRRELREEYGLEAIKCQGCSVYENIAGDPEHEEQWHWVIVLMVVMVDDVTQAINKEPEKHDDMRFIPIEDVLENWFLDEYPFHESFSLHFKKNKHNIYQSANAFINSKV